ncbi:MAG: YibE/F family protein, partial [Chloroflexota bacterium]
RLVVGKEPVQVCVVGALLAMTPSLYLTYGINWKTHSALMGLGVSLLVTGILAAASMDWGHMTGFSSDEATFLVAAIDTPLDLRDLLLGGIIISVLGVLDDVCIGQASTILELRKANPALKWRNLFQRGMRVGRDHIASVVNTLMMAYIGAAMPLFLLLFVSNTPMLQTLNRELLAEEIVRTLVGSLGLIMAVPITSVIASLVAQNLEIEPLPRM